MSTVNYPRKVTVTMFYNINFVMVHITRKFSNALSQNERKNLEFTLNEAIHKERVPKDDLDGLRTFDQHTPDILSMSF